ncbi:MAG: metal transporter [Candidatus Pacebacteria bacterium]|nr:metal transporter [Candidatus Paceibacterota bacterium]MDR3583117.1 metal transporter [Candidatus Paceibacterota bacterium]
MEPATQAAKSFREAEEGKGTGGNEYVRLEEINRELFNKGMWSGISAIAEFYWKKVFGFQTALLETMIDGNGALTKFAEREAAVARMIAEEYPKAIRYVESEYGLHLDNGGYIKVAETPRFELYQVLPTNDVQVREGGKPIVIIPPYVLGPHILAFLPGEQKSYVHAFANQGIPTYIRIVRNINTTPDVQIMTGEDDATDTRFFCDKVSQIHHKPITLSGFCQGGFIATLDLLSGELDGLVDALITCVSPMDGTRSKAITDYINCLPSRYRELDYAVKTLPNGNRVVDGGIMSWVFKLMSMDSESPVAAFHRDLEMFSKSNGNGISKTAAALNYWMKYDQRDLPLEITRLSHQSYTVPVAPDGALPVQLFGRPLNFKRIKEDNIRWLLCYAAGDNLIDPPAALAPLDYIKVEVTKYSKGHGAIATSHSDPKSKTSLDHVFPDGSRGPVRFQLDLDAALVA